MVATAVAAAGMTFTVMMVMVVAADIGIICQLTGQQSFHSGIGTAGNTAEETDAGGGKCHLGACSDATANQNFGIQIR